MDNSEALGAFAALAQETRLDIFRMLVRAAPDGLAAGVIAERTGVRQNTLSAHLAVLARAGLVEGTRDGRSIVYSADLSRAAALIGFLLDECCDGRREVCAPLLARLERQPIHTEEPCCD